MDIRDVLGRISLFADALTPSQRDQLAARCRIVTYPRDAVVMSEGDFGGFMLAIISGRLGVTTGSRRERHPVATIGPGEIVGEMALLTGARRAATVTALESTIAVEISKVALEAMFLQAPDLFDRLGALLADRQRRLDEPQAAPRRASEIIDAMRRLFGRPSVSH